MHMPTRTAIATGWLLLAAATGGCYHQYLRVTGSDQLPEKQEKTVYSYAWGLVHSRDSVAVCGDTNALDQVEVKSNFGMTMLGILTLGIVVPRRMVWYCSTPRECVDDIGLATPANSAACAAPRVAPLPDVAPTPHVIPSAAREPISPAVTQ
jgi:hypothetical protein